MTVTGEPTLDLSLVILASNERPNTSLFLEMTDIYRGELDRQDRSYEVIVVDDGIGGEFLDTVLEVQKTWSKLKVIQFRRSFGESVALNAAVKHARGRYILTSSWYLQVDPQGLTRAVQLLDEGADYVAMRRHPRCDGGLARFQSWLFNAYTRWITKVRLHDLNCSFRAFKREVVEEISFHGDLFRFIGILAHQQGFKVVEIPLKHIREEGGSASLTPGLYLRRFLDILALFFLIKFTKKPLRFFGMVGTGFFLLGFGVSLFMLYLKLIENQALADKPMLVLGIFLMVLGVIIGSIGLIGEIIIFAHGRDFRDYHIARVISGGEVSAEPRDEEEGIRILSLAGSTERAWSTYVEAHPQATLFHGLAWQEVLLETLNHESLSILAFRKGAVVGVLPLVGIKSLFLGRSAVSVPFGVYGGILADDEHATRALCAEARRRAEGFGASYVELRHLYEPPGLDDLPVSDLYHTFIRELPSDPEEVLGTLPRKARAEVRKARRNPALSVTVDDIELDRFHDLFALNKRRLGSPSFPKSLFHKISTKLGKDASILGVRLEGEVVAAVMSFRFRDTWMAYYSGATDVANRVSGNNLMYCALMEEAVRRGARFFDFGRSRIGTGSFAFKKNQGFTPRPLRYQYLLEAGQEIPAHNNSNPRYELARRVFRVLPRFAGDRVGSYVCKRLPI